MEEMSPVYTAGRKELTFGLFAVISGLALSNFVIYGGLNLGFALAIIAATVSIAGYLLARGCRVNGYSATLFTLSIVICAGFARSDDGFVKFVMLGFLTVSINLAFCITAGQALRCSAGISSVLDGIRAFLIFGFEGMAPACRGLHEVVRSGSPGLKKGGSVALGLAVCVPVLAIVIPLLVSADAAFSGVMALLPTFSMGELISTLIFGVPAALFLYSQATALVHRPHHDGSATQYEISVSHLTVNTVLGGICVVFGVYLLSQLAYFGGGFAGILPEGYTMAEYARRGFFEMAWLSAIDLGILAAAAAFVRRKAGKMPLSTRLLCLFIALVTVFFVVSASAKMFMYIGAYGLTRLRVLTEVIMVFLGIATATVALWLFLPKLPYFKVVLLTALVMGTTVLWADVDTVVANYNVTAYQQGYLETVDVDYLSTLGDGAKPHIARLVNDADFNVARAARDCLIEFPSTDNTDFRSWNFANYAAEKITDKTE